MLKLQAITKDYSIASDTVHALKGIDIEFRDSEFVSILGPSGCGKTTLLNIIGGLDHYTDGDLSIDGVSTKQFKDRDWDTYRNHRIGFIFQSYNLIPHQTILENVELALTIAGMDKTSRIAKAKEALDKVGLKEQYGKKPNQLSGGQCQRVAIARALVNEPEILLADEPTGALDTNTSVQIMELIKEISSDRLVIMVTHNPELAEQYSTRIVRLLDGNIVSDSDPYTADSEPAAETAEAETAEAETTGAEAADVKAAETETADVKTETAKTKRKKEIGKKSKLSFWQAFRLSARNLRSKLKRTIMVCLAGSIGIIGVATVLAVSSGVQGYIRNMQDDMLSGNPITISETAMDLNSIMSAMSMGETADAVVKNIEDGKINVNSVIEYLVSRADAANTFSISNDITEDYVAFVKDMPKEYYSAITTHYGISEENNIYTDFHFTDENGNVGTQHMSLSAGRQVYTSLLEQTEYASYSSMITSFAEGFSQMPDNTEFILSQYDILSRDGKIPTAANEIAIVVNGDHELSDLTLAQLGYYSQKEFFNTVFKAADHKELVDESVPDREQFTFDELIGKKFTWYPNNTVFTQTTNPLLRQIYPFSYNAYEDENWTTGRELTVTAILVPKEGTSYGCLSSGFYHTVALTNEILKDSETSQIVAYIKNDNEGEDIASGIYKYTTTVEDENGEPVAVEREQSYGILYNYSYYFDDDKGENGDNDPSDNWHENQVGFVGDVSQMAVLMGSFMNLPYSNTHTLSLRDVGGNKIPSTIAVYPVNFDIKEKVTAYLDLWNGEGDITVNGKTLSADERAEITYSDNLSIIISMVSEMINIVTAALVAFTALSLVVSTVMIAIITYVSVIERVKEIGVIRSLGGRKGDVSRLFNAETFIIGAISGLVGIGITYIIELIVNLVLNGMFGIMIVNLTIPTALIMVAISIGLTLISGLIPASIAAKKDPVDALRSE